MKQQLKLRFLPFVILPLLILSACDSGDLDKPSTVIDHTQADGRILKVVLESGYPGASATFSNLDDFENYYEEVQDQGEVKVNAELYAELSHGLDPIELSVLKMDKTVDIGSATYLASAEQLMLKESSDAEFKTDAFYGIDGREEEREFRFIAENFDSPQTIAEYDFKNPSGKEIQNGIVKAENFDSDIEVLSSSLCSHIARTDCDRWQAGYSAGGSSAYPWAYIFGLNKEVGSWRRRAEALTQLQYCGSGGCVGASSSVGSGYRYDLFVKVNGNGSYDWEGPLQNSYGKADVYISVRRGRNKTARSTHTMKIGSTTFVNNEYIQ